MMDILTHKQFCLEKYKGSSVLSLINRKLLIHKQLERPPRSYVVYSDLHGSYDKFVYWLKNGFGYFKLCIQEILGDSYSEEICQSYEKLLLLVNRTRFDSIKNSLDIGEQQSPLKNQFLEKVPKKFVIALDELEKHGLSRRRILKDILEILRGVTRGDERRIIKIVPVSFLENILKLYAPTDDSSYEAVVSAVVEKEAIFSIVTSMLVKLILSNTFDKHINLGDTFDRGEEADKLMGLYRRYFNNDDSPIPLHYIWGNHDILWMGAGIGNPILCMTALRISMRYNNVEFLGRYGFNLESLRSFARKTYKNTPIGKYVKAKNFTKWSKEDAIKMTKALLVLESKLTLTWLKDAMDEVGDETVGRIDYRRDFERQKELMNFLPVPGLGDDEKEWQEFIGKNPLYLDPYFPTVDPKKLGLLTEEEKAIVDDLVLQFTTLPKLQKDIKWLFEFGEAYRVVDHTLYFHAAIPSTKDMNLAETKGLKGRKLFDFIQRDLKRIGEFHREGKTITRREKMLLWYLWCGRDSAFFCKDKMATLERAIFEKEIASRGTLTTWKENPNPFYKNIRNDDFLNKVLKEFHADKICMGHTPVKNMQQAILSSKHGAFIVDGGASEAYGDRGAVLINTPDYNYMTLHPSLESLKEAEERDRLPDLLTTPLEEKKHLRLRHMDKGYFLRKELEAIDELIDDNIGPFSQSYFYES